MSEKATQPYVPGMNAGWIKVKTSTWREANRVEGMPVKLEG